MFLLRTWPVQAVVWSSLINNPARGSQSTTRTAKREIEDRKREKEREREREK